MSQVRDCKKCNTPIQGYNAKKRTGKQKGFRCRKCYNATLKVLQRNYKIQQVLRDTNAH